MSNRYCLAVEAGNSRIKAFIGNMTQDGNVQVNGSGMMPTAGMAQGKVTDVEALALSVAQAAECAAMAAGRMPEEVYLGLGGLEVQWKTGLGSVAISSGTVTAADLEKVGQAAALANIGAEQAVIHIQPRRFWVDKRDAAAPLGLSGSQLETQADIITISKELLDKLLKRLEELELAGVKVVAAPLTAAQALTAKHHANYMMVDIGAAMMEIVVYCGKKMHSMWAMPLGGNDITSDIMQALDITFTHAEDIKKFYNKLNKNLYGSGVTVDYSEHGLVDKQCNYDFLHNVIEKRLTEYIYLVQNCWETVVPGERLEKIFLTGGCSRLSSLVDGLEEASGVPVEILVPGALAVEYAQPANMACFGVLKHGLDQTPVQEETGGAWQRVYSRVKDFFVVNKLR